MSVRYHNVETASKVLQRMAGYLRFRGRLNSFMVRSVWTETVGDMVAKHTVPLRVRKDVLVLAVESSAWMNELQFHIPAILDRLRQKLPEKNIRSIKMKVIPLAEFEAQAEREELPLTDYLDEQRIKNITDHASDPELKTIIERAYRYQLRVRKRISERMLQSLGKSSE